MIESQKYQRRLQEVEAVRWDGTQEHAKEIANWLPPRFSLSWAIFGSRDSDETVSAEFNVIQDEGALRGSLRLGPSVRPVSATYPGDVLVSDGEQAELVSAKMFEALYESVEERRSANGRSRAYSLPSSPRGRDK